MTTMSIDDLRAGHRGTVIAVHLSYRSRAAERGRTPAHPSYFLKPASSLGLDGDRVERPEGMELLAFEGEIALVVADRTHRVTPEQAWSHIGWVTAANDLGVYDMRAADRGSNVRSKGRAGYTPIGPRLIPAAGLDPARLRVRTWLDGELVQEDVTGNLLFDLPSIVADLSQNLVLEAGDIVLTGTPAGSSVVLPGQTVEVEVDAFGPSDELPNARLDAISEPVTAADRALGSPPSAGVTSGRLRTEVVAGPAMAAYGDGPRVDDAQRVDAWGSHAAAGVPEPFALTEDLRKTLGSVAVATLSSQLRSRGFPDASIDGVHPLSPGDRLVGQARTLRFVPYRPDLFARRGGGFNPHKRAFDTIGEGEVLVIEARGVSTTGTIGDILALRAQTRGAAGVVTDGGVRDAAAVAAMDLPVFTRGAHPAVLGRRHVPWETDVVVTCGGTAVEPGDVVVGDDDGVVVIPPHLVGEVAEAALEQETVEAFVAEQVARGTPVDGLYPMNDEWKARYATWRRER